MNLLLTPDIENYLVKKAQHLGTTPELLALELLRKELLNGNQESAHGSATSLAEFLGQHVGVLSSKTLAGEDARLSEDCGRKFAIGLLAEHRKASS